MIKIIGFLIGCVIGYVIITVIESHHKQTYNDRLEKITKKAILKSYKKYLKEKEKDDRKERIQ